MLVKSVGEESQNFWMIGFVVKFPFRNISRGVRLLLEGHGVELSLSELLDTVLADFSSFKVKRLSSSH